jgi:hypothetical protein
LLSVGVGAREVQNYSVEGRWRTASGAVETPGVTACPTVQGSGHPPARSAALSASFGCGLQTSGVLPAWPCA